MTEDASVFQSYLHDLGVLVKEGALEAKKNAKRSSSNFDLGYMSGFCRIVSLMQQQAEAFDIPLEQIGLSGIDPYVDLV